VTVTGRGFGPDPGTVLLVPANAAGSGAAAGTDFALPSGDIRSWSDTAVVFTVPRSLAAGQYAVYVLPPGLGPWSQAGEAPLLTVAGCPCGCGG